MTESWQLLSSGTPEEFVAALEQEVMEHPATTHPYLVALGEGTLPNMQKALEDFAYQYAFYSREFTRYLENVLGGLTDMRHRATIEENLSEERGDMVTPGGDDTPHRILFGEFREALGVDDAYEAEHSPCTTVLVWRDLFLQKCQSRQEGVGVGAIGLGTEYIVSTVYAPILKAVEAHTDLNERERLFLVLHSECDDEHGKEFCNITADIAKTTESREAIRFGVNSALNLRAAFWDVMYARAMEMDAVAA